MITMKRAYEPASDSDGYRVLIDRLWPRGISKSKARIDAWEKTLPRRPNCANGTDMIRRSGTNFRGDTCTSSAGPRRRRHLTNLFAARGAAASRSSTRHARVTSAMPPC